MNNDVNKHIGNSCSIINVQFSSIKHINNAVRY